MFHIEKMSRRRTRYDVFDPMISENSYTKTNLEEFIRDAGQDEWNRYYTVVQDAKRQLTTRMTPDDRLRYMRSAQYRDEMQRLAYQYVRDLYDRGMDLTRGNQPLEVPVDDTAIDDIARELRARASVSDPEYTATLHRLIWAILNAY